MLSPGCLGSGWEWLPSEDGLAIDFDTSKEDQGEGSGFLGSSPCSAPVPHCVTLDGSLSSLGL